MTTATESADTRVGTLLALAERCEREEPSRALDDAVAIAAGYPEINLRIYRVPYTTSLDAAVTLVPEGWRLRNMDQGDPASRHLPTSTEIIPLAGSDALWKAYERSCGDRHRMMGFGKTLALAICAAALRARAAPP